GHADNLAAALAGGVCFTWNGRIKRIAETLPLAAIASADGALFAASLHDELHEPYRASTAPVFTAVREQLPAGAAGATISGSGPTVIVWADDERADECARELEERFAEATVLPLRVSTTGVGHA